MTRAHRLLGNAFVQAGRQEEARESLLRAVELSADDPAGCAAAHHSLARSWERSGDPAQALRHATLMLRLHEESGATRFIAKAHNVVGWYHAQVGEFGAAREHCLRALALNSEHRESPVTEGATLDSLGYIAHHLGELDEAAARYGEALALFEESGASYQHADTLCGLAETLCAVGRIPEAREVWWRAHDEYSSQQRASEAAAVLRRLEVL